MTPEERKHKRNYMSILRMNKDILSHQEYATLKGQIKAGDLAGGLTGLERIAKRKHHELRK